ncbi:YicC/YloC family endoribonuclease [Bdellovibrio sp. 22V]|uniref:YicC/YloC family endoribonuclease n=1 Tax=Bdellovibrio TaxID=958 RepID=UPI0025428A51|nr:YicC/YloC family endoribonuclease [Bdellovibrio sp. 22V]WII71946.1 YicC/YloC family endoribonuclease [Bdellovibrio sp. 22V]
MKSMTGYGTARVQTKDVSVEVSIRSVNGRFLEPRFHLPREFVAMEAELKKILSSTLLRGTVDVFVSRRVRNAANKAQMTVNDALAKKYMTAYKHLSKELGVPFQVHLEVLARLPEIIKVEETYELFTGEDKVLKKAFIEACRNCDRERTREGKALRKDLEKLLLALEKQVRVISELRGEANAQLQDKFEQKIRARLKGNDIDPTRLSQEIVIQLEKADINEELTRLSEHIKNYRQLVGSQQAEGKKLDFYTQELLREVNTIGSKSQVAKITHAVVEAKTLIERLREQVQNVQ